jgi:hypothetical protein
MCKLGGIPTDRSVHAEDHCCLRMASPSRRLLRERVPVCHVSGFHRTCSGAWSTNTHFPMRASPKSSRCAQMTAAPMEHPTSVASCTTRSPMTDLAVRTVQACVMTACTSLPHDPHGALLWLCVNRSCTHRSPGGRAPPESPADLPPAVPHGSPEATMTSTSQQALPCSQWSWRLKVP